MATNLVINKVYQQSFFYSEIQVSQGRKKLFLLTKLQQSSSKSGVSSSSKRELAKKLAKKLPKNFFSLSCSIAEDHDDDDDLTATSGQFYELRSQIFLSLN